MKITEFVEYIWSDKQSRYLLLRDKSINWTGPVCQLKGASATQDELQTSEAAFYNTMTQDYNTTFGENQAIMSTLTSQLNPIVAAGPNQQGYNTAELTNLNSQALQGTGQSYANASQALKENQAASGGGNTYLPSGVQSQQQAGLASSAANQESNQLLGIQQADYQQGFSMYNNAMSGLAGVAGMENPTSYSNSATGAAGAANNEANAVQAANQQGMNDLMGLATGAMGAAGSVFEGKCWIAAEIFGGWKDKRTIAVRKWLANEFSQHWYGRMFNRWYSANGRKVAKNIQKNRVERWAFQKLFEWFLAQTKKEGACR
jgi:hypothetical protein